MKKLLTARPLPLYREPIKNSMKKAMKALPSLLLFCGAVGCR
jgi:hypothetical protein